MSANNITPGVIKFKRGTVVPSNLQEGELFIKQVGEKRLLYTSNGSTIQSMTNEFSGLVGFHVGDGTGGTIVFNTTAGSFGIAIDMIGAAEGIVAVWSLEPSKYTICIKQIITNGLISIGAFPQTLVNSTMSPEFGEGVGISLDNLDQRSTLVYEVLPIPHNIYYDL